MSLELDEEDLELLGGGFNYYEKTNEHLSRLHHRKLERNRTAKRIWRDPDAPKTNKAHLHVPIKCVRCGNETVANRPNRKKHCSDKCRQAQLRAARKARGLTARGSQPHRKKTREEKLAAQRASWAKCYYGNPEFRKARIAAASKWQAKKNKKLKQKREQGKRRRERMQQQRKAA